jgi:hypothetical protein
MKVIRLTESDLHSMIKEAVMSILKEDGLGGATNANISADATYDVPAFGDKETLDRKGGKNHSISMNHVEDETDVISKPIYK